MSSASHPGMVRDRDIIPVMRVDAPVRIRIDPKRRDQTMVGFGAALTDASAIVIQRDMSPAQRHRLIRTLFSPTSGIGLSMLRLTIGASDFSPRDYSLDQVPRGQVDPGLRHFSLAPIEKTVIPTVKEILEINPQVKIIASPWSPPAWMKTSDSLIGGTLLPRYHKALAAYLVKYVDALGRRGIPVYALTLQNEPGFSPTTYPGMKMSAATRADIIAHDLGPALAHRAQHTRILDWDHNWDHPQQPLQVFSNPVASPYVAGVAWHCYAGDVRAQTLVHKAYPRKQAFLTECSDGDWEPAKSGGMVWLVRHVLLASTRHWDRGVILWNLALDAAHGPHLGGCGTCIGVVTIHPTGKVTPSRDFYALAHFSQFVKRGAVRIGSSEAVDGIANVAFANPHGGAIVVVVVNTARQARKVAVRLPGRAFGYTLPARSVATFVWPQPPRHHPGAASP